MLPVRNQLRKQLDNTYGINISRAVARSPRPWESGHIERIELARGLTDRLERLRRYRFRDQLLLGAVVAVVTALNMVWIATETRPPHWDMALHLLDSLSYLNLLDSGSLIQELTQYKFYPPLIDWVALPFYKVFGTSIAAAVFSNAVFLAILTFATYGIGRRLWNRSVGLLAAVFVLTSPMIVSSSKEFMLDMPLTAMVALALYLLVRSREFADRRFSLWLGVAIGFGMLEKWTFAAIFALPLLWGLANAVARDLRGRRYAGTVNALGALLIAFAIAGVWYLPNLDAVTQQALANGNQTLGKPNLPGVGSFTSDLWYAWNLLSYELFLIPALFFLAGLVVMATVGDGVSNGRAPAYRRQAWRRNVYPLLLIAGTYLFFTFLRNKDARYEDPLLPGVAIVATYWITLVAGRFRSWLAGALVVYGAVAFLAISFGTKLLPQNVQIGNGQYALTLFQQSGYIIGPPTHEQWHMVDMFDAIRSDPNGYPKTLMYEGPDSIWFNFIALLYYGQRYHIPVTYQLTTSAPAPSEVQLSSPANFLAVRAATAGPPPAGVRLVREYVLPDKTFLLLYRRA